MDGHTDNILCFWVHGGLSFNLCNIAVLIYTRFYTMHIIFFVALLGLYLKLVLSTTPLLKGFKWGGENLLNMHLSEESLPHPRYTVYCVSNYASTPGQLGIAKVCWLTTQLGYPTGLFIYPKMVYFSKEAETDPVMVGVFTPPSHTTNGEYTYVKVANSILKNNDCGERGPHALIEVGTANFWRLWLVRLEANGKRSYPTGAFPRTFEMKTGDQLALFPCQKSFSSDIYEFEQLRSHETALKMATSPKSSSSIKGIYITIGELPVDNQNLTFTHGFRLSRFFRLQRWFSQVHNTLAPIKHFQVRESTEIPNLLQFVAPQFTPHELLATNIGEGCVSKNQRYGVMLKPHQLIISEKLSSAWDSMQRTLEDHPSPFTLDIKLEGFKLQISVQGEPSGLPVTIEVHPHRKPIVKEGKEIYWVEPGHRIFIYRGDGACKEQQFINASMCDRIACVAESLYFRGIMVVKVQRPPASTTFNFNDLHDLHDLHELKKGLKSKKNLPEIPHEALLSYRS